MIAVTNMRDKMAVIATSIRVDDLESEDEGRVIMGEVTAGQMAPQMPVRPPVVFIAVHDPRLRAREELLGNRNEFK